MSGLDCVGKQESSKEIASLIIHDGLKLILCEYTHVVL